MCTETTIASADCERACALPVAAETASLSPAGMGPGVIAYCRARVAAVLPAGSLRARLAAGTFWTLVGSVASQGIAAVTGFAVARVLGRTGYGELGMVSSTLALFGTVGGLGFGVTASKHVAQYRESEPERAGRVSAMCILAAAVCAGIAAVIVFALAGPLARYALHAPQLITPIRVGAASLVFGAIVAAQAGALMGLEAFRSLSGVMIWTSLAGSVAAFLGVLVAGVTGYLAGMALVSGAACAVYGRVLRRESRRAGFELRFDHLRSELDLLWRYTMPTVLSTFVVTPVYWLCDARLVNTPNGYSELGMFNAADQWRTILLFLPGMIASPLLPILSQLYTTGQTDRLRTVLRKCLILNIAIVGGAALPLAVFGRHVMGLYGRSFVAGTPTFWTVLVVAVLLSVGVVTGHLIVTAGKLWYGFAFNAIWAVIVVGLTFQLAPRFGAFGVGLSFAIGYVVHTAIQTTFLVWTVARLSRPARRPA